MGTPNIIAPFIFEFTSFSNDGAHIYIYMRPGWISTHAEASSASHAQEYSQYREVVIYPTTEMTTTPAVDEVKRSLLDRHK